MAAQELNAFLAAAWACAQTMADNASYIEAHLPSVESPPPHAQAVREVCWSLIEAWESVLCDLTELESSDIAPASFEVQSKVAVIHFALERDLRMLNEAVTALNSASADDRRYGTAYLLVAESGTNVLNAYAVMSRAGDAYADALGL